MQPRRMVFTIMGSLGGGAAAFGEAIKEFQLPTFTNDKKSDDAQYLTPPDIELDVHVTATDEDQCQKEPGSQAGQVSSVTSSSLSIGLRPGMSPQDQEQRAARG